MSRAALLAACALAACGGSTPTSEPIPAAPPAIDAAPVAEAPLAPAEAPPSAPPPVEAPPSCRGAALELMNVLADDACITKGVRPPLPPEIAVALAPDPAVLTEGRGETAVTLRNTGAAPVAVVVPFFCDLERQIETEIHDASGARVDQVFAPGDGCGKGVGCGGVQIRFVLEPGGIARYPVPLTAATSRMKGCDARPGKPLRKGAYRLEVRAMFLEDPVSQALEVR
jgi:hypothetical protein